VNDSVIFVTPWLHDGGIERNLEIKAPWLARRGYRVAVAAWHMSPTLAGRPNPVFETLQQAGIPLIDLSVTGPRHRLLQRAHRLAAVCTDGGFELMVGHETLANAAALIAKLLLRGRCRVIGEFHNAMIYPTPGFGPLMAWSVRQLYRAADGFLAVSDAVGDEAAAFFGLGRDRIETVYNPFSPDTIGRLAAQAPDIPLPGTPFVVACGRLVKAKGFDDLIHAFSRVRRRHEVTLVILGDGPERSALEACARQYGVAADVRLPGFVRNPFAVFARATAFVLSSRFGEAFSRVLVEAMTCGVPVISSRCPWGPEEVLAGGRYGVLYDVGDVDQLTEALDQVLREPARSRAIVTEARRRVAEFSEDTVLPRLEQVYFGRPRRSEPSPAVAVAARQ
jgi:glycosyltransferase involved in cell wall biosynthesis